MKRSRKTNPDIERLIEEIGWTEIQLRMIADLPEDEQVPFLAVKCYELGLQRGRENARN